MCRRVQCERVMKDKSNYSSIAIAHREYPIAPVGVKDVKITDSFWQPRIEKARTVSLPMLLDRVAVGGESMDGRLTEAASYFLMAKPDAKLQARTRDLSLKSLESLRRQKGTWVNRGDGPFFSVGHYIEGAIAFQQATADQVLLEGAIEIADDLANTFAPGKRYDISNHEGIELALVKLYRSTSEDRYLKLAQFLVDTRGTTNGGRVLVGSYAQDHMPVKSQERGIGHCVRATYLYSGVADLAALLPDAAYRQAAIRIWEDVVAKRTFLTGGVGSYRDEEDFGDDFDLPNLGCWNEICASVGYALWNHRMFLMTGQSRYSDLLERILYNGLLAGVSLTGDRFLYQAPLKVAADFERHAWFGPNCCPPNITRLLGELGGLIYASTDRGLWVNLFVGSEAKCMVGKTPVAVTQLTNYPWDGGVKLTLAPNAAVRFALNVRVPGWQQGEAMLGGLYRYTSTQKSPVQIRVNGSVVQHTLDNGYAVIEREWCAGDVVEFKLPMDVKRIAADKRVPDNRGMVALERGPLVYCVEAADNRAGVSNLVLPDAAHVEYSYIADLLGGVGTIGVAATALSRGAGNAVLRQKQDAVAIPYYAFGNRARGEMAVWMAREESRAVIAPAASIASRSKVSSSCGSGTVADNYPGKKPPTFEQRFTPNAQDGSGEIGAICDQIEPPDSGDGSGIFLRLRPQTGDKAWVQYDFAEPATVTSVCVYWKDDKQFVALPKEWQLFYKDGDAWKPVRAQTAYGVERDRYNTVKCDPAKTSALRLDIQLRPTVYKKGKLGPPDGDYLDQDLIWYEGGVIEWKVNA